MRPEIGYPHNLWTNDTRKGRKSVPSFNLKLTGRYAVEAGVIEDASDEEFTPHWFRHFFTTQLQPGRGDHPRHLEPSMIKYLRGDVMEDIMGEYTHDWGDTIRPAYEDAIYQFGLYD